MPTTNDLDSTPVPAGEPSARRQRGRPPGVKMRTAAEQLRHHHFSFLRMLIVAHFNLRGAWMRYLAFEGGPDDERHFASRARALMAQVRLAATERGLTKQAMTALSGLEHHLAGKPPSTTAHDGASITPAMPQAAPVSAIPSLDEWITASCHEIGLDSDFYSQAEWLEQYQDAFGLDQAPPPSGAITLALSTSAPLPSLGSAAPSAAVPDDSIASVDAQLDALNLLSGALARPPALSDGLASWLSSDLAKRLASTAVQGRLLPIINIGNLIAMINTYHHRWWVHVPRLGAVRAARLVGWLSPLAEDLGHPIKEIAQRPLVQLTLERRARLEMLHTDDRLRFGVVPLDRLVVPPELDGRRGTFRSADDNALGVHTDLDAIRAWLRRHEKSPRTHEAYSRIIERFYLWSLLVKRKAMSSLTEDDLRDYGRFMANPPADWVQERRVGRDSAEWRPFKGPQGTKSIRMNFTAIGSLWTSLEKAAYLKANAAHGLASELKLQGHRLNTDRSFNDRQWSWLIQCWTEMYQAVGPAAAASPAASPTEVTLGFPLPDADRPDQVFLRAAALRRTRLVLELGASTGLRLIEFVTTRMGSVQRQLVEGESVWVLEVLGKGGKTRLLAVRDEIKTLLDQHHADMTVAGTSRDLRHLTLRSLRNPGATNDPQAGMGDHSAMSSGLHGSAPSPAPLRLDWATPGTAAHADAFDSALRPLVGALRPAVRRRKLDDRGLPTWDDVARGNADAYGALDPSALYQSLKRFFVECSQRAEFAPDVAEIDGERLRAASTHWLRHFFANSAINDDVDLSVLRDALGHASLATTSIYLHTERDRMVKELGKMKRRG